jgi:hypothetical protein
MATKPLINYFNRDFESLRVDLMNYAKNYHSDAFKYFNTNSPDMLYLELLAYIGDTLNYQLDKSFNEAFLQTAQARESLVRISQDLGFYNFFPKPSSTQTILSINVPAIPNEDGSAMIPDPSYLFGIFPGMICQASNGTNFECLDEINFSQAFNRRIIPNLDANGLLVDYTIEKSVALYAGQTKVQRYYVGQSSSKPFLEILLDDVEVTEVLGVIVRPGNTYAIPTDEDFRGDTDNVYTQVENLAIDKVFTPTDIPLDLQSLVNVYTDMTINYGEWVNKPKRFIVRRDKNNQTYLTFGSTLVNYNSWNQAINSIDTTSLGNFSLNQILNNMSLGEVPPIDSTLFIKFRSGAGVKTNVLNNAITDITEKQIFSPSAPGNLTIFEQVKSSLKIKSSLPAVGGTNALSNEEIKNSVGKVFSANDRAVTYEDVKHLIADMPIKYGQPFRISYEEIKPQLLSFNQIQNYLAVKLDELLLAPSTVARELKAQEITGWINNLPAQTAFINSQTNASTSISQITDSETTTPNTNEHQLWFGEKCRLHILGLNSDLQPTTLYKDENDIWRSPNTLLKENIKNYLREKRVIGDWIDIVDAKVINIQVEFTILADKKNKQQVVIDCLTRMRNYFSVYNWQINQPIFISNVQTLLQEIDGVINVVDLKFYNIFEKDLITGRQYSPKEIGRYKYLDTFSVNSQNNKFQMLDIDNVIVSAPDTFLSVKFPEADIVGRAL